MTVLLERSESPPETALGTQTVARLVKERAMRTPDLVALREKGLWDLAGDHLGRVLGASAIGRPWSFGVGSRSRGSGVYPFRGPVPNG